MKWLKHPQMVLLYGGFGGVVGGLLGPQWYFVQMSLVQTALSANYRGFYSLLINFVIASGAALGAVTGCALVHSFGKYHRVTGRVLVLFGLAAALFMLSLGIPYATNGSRRMALALYGVGFVWSSQLILWGSYLILRPRQRT